MSFHKIIVFFFSGFFHPQNMFLFHVLGICLREFMFLEYV